MSGETLRERCRGKWRGLLQRYGVVVPPASKHGPCPMCGGKDRFRFDDKDGVGTWICNQCGAGDGLKLLMAVKGWSFSEMAVDVERVVGSVRSEAPTTKKRNDDWTRRMLNELWSVGMPIEADDPVGRYLAARGLSLTEYPAALRFVDRCRYNDKPPTEHPAMVAKFVAPDGKPSTLHRTYLTRFGGKAELDEPRLLMPGGMAKGGAVRLAPVGPVLGIAEGIETAMSATQLWSVPCWAALNADGVMTWEPPEGVREVMIFGDNDASYTGQSAAYHLAKRLQLGRKIKADVFIPPDKDSDWNDALQGDRAA